MYIIVLLLSRACAEWVEISQQHYRKPVRFNYNVPTLAITEIYQPTKAVYTNDTLQEHVWNKAHINKVNKHGSIQRVQLESNPVKAPSLRPGSETNRNDPTRYSNKNDYRGASVMPVKNKYEDYNIDSSSEFKTRLNNDSVKDIINNEPNKENNKPAIEISENNVKTVINKANYVRNNSSINNIKRYGLASSSEASKKKVNTVPLTTSAIEIFKNMNRTPAKENADIRNSSEKINKYQNNPSNIENHEAVNQTATGSHKSKPGNDNNKKHMQQENISEQKSKAPLKVKEGSKSNAIENLIKFAKIVTDTIRENTHRTVNSKTRYLENLKESILANIEERIDAAWPDDTPSRQRRASRAAPRGHVQIPSSESALMTISFLTFAVFLIKLVLVIIALL
ncbi:hypothetical protein evm_005509 [Chilo suppressalis]|nr:hypothetical protein evm_005509 [Chilo suppressalis]